MGIGFIFCAVPKSDTRDGLIDFVPLPDAELSVFASSAISTSIQMYLFVVNHVCKLKLLNKYGIQGAYFLLTITVKFIKNNARKYNKFG